MNPPGDKIPVTVKRCLCPPETLVPEISSLPSDRTLLPVSSHQSWKRGGGREGERERIDTKLYSSLSLVVCVYLACHHLLNGSTTALNPSVSEDRGGTSCSDRTRITLEVSALRSQCKDWVWKIPCRGQKEVYRGIWTGEDISGKHWMCACQLWTFSCTALLFPAALLSSLEQEFVCVLVYVCVSVLLFSAFSVFL